MATRPINNSTANVPVTGRSAEATGTAATRKAKKTDAASKAGEAVGAQADFDVNLSPESKEKAAAFQKALEIAKNTPDVREDRVAELKKKIQEGTYEVDSGKIADGMMREAVKERLAEVEPR
jgi:negative regulator of flagellin synthesis FlgM